MDETYSFGYWVRRRRKALDLTHKYNDYDQLRTIRPVTAYPGSPLYYDAIQKGLLKGPEDFFDRFSNSDLITVNHTELPTSECYDLLFEANKELINKHYQHTNGNMLEAERLIQQYKDLYNGNADNFRGVRHYDSFNDKKFKKEKGNSGSSN